jgi:hypothetical protein
MSARRRADEVTAVVTPFHEYSIEILGLTFWTA